MIDAKQARDKYNALSDEASQRYQIRVAREKEEFEDWKVNFAPALLENEINSIGSKILEAIDNLRNSTLYFFNEYNDKTQYLAEQLSEQLKAKGYEVKIYDRNSDDRDYYHDDYDKIKLNIEW